MLSTDYILNNLAKVKAACKQKNREMDLEQLVELIKTNKKLVTQISELRQKRNELAHRIGGQARQGKDKEAIEQGKALKLELKKIEEEQKLTLKKLDQELLKVPNVPYAEVPVGKDEQDNQEIKRVGKVPDFGFKPKTHLELFAQHDLADLKRGAKVSGRRGYFLKNQAAVLQISVLWYVYLKLIKKGYTPLIAPAIVNEFTLFGNGQFPWGKDEVYHLEKDNKFLAGTAEVPTTAYFADEILNKKDLPKKFVAFSPCFRRESGSYGKDTKGIYRVHEFWKVEQVIIAEADDKKARAYHEELQTNLEEVMQDFELPYRVLLMCTGDMGEPQVKKYDTEAWMPSRKSYGEIASNSIMTDFQARRLKIRYRTKAGETKHVYTLNNTAIASPRILIALLENHQQADGSINIPEKLQPLCGFKKIN